LKNFEAHGQSCVVCGKSGSGLVTYDHILTQKARPDLKYDKRNLMPVCFYCHLSKGQKGINWMAERYINYKKWLVDNGWAFDQFRKNGS